MKGHGRRHIMRAWARPAVGHDEVRLSIRARIDFRTQWVGLISSKINTPIDLHKFHTAKVTVSAEWDTLYDQGGIVLFIPDEDIKKWVKTGIEYVDGKPYIGTVATSRWSDWSLVPLPESANGKVTIYVERETKNGERVESLWIYFIDEFGKKVGIREITWWFKHDVVGGEQPDEGGRNLLVGVYAARPTVPQGEGREKESLEVHLDGFEVTLFDD